MSSFGKFEEYQVELKDGTKLNYNEFRNVDKNDKAKPEVYIYEIDGSVNFINYDGKITDTPNDDKYNILGGVTEIVADTNPEDKDEINLLRPSGIDKPNLDYGTYGVAKEHVGKFDKFTHDNISKNENGVYRWNNKTGE